LGICPFLGVSKKLGTAMGMSGAVIFVMTLASAVTWTIDYFFLRMYDMEKYMRTIVFILVIAALVQLIEIILKKLMPALYKALGIYLPLITTNCAVLGVALLNMEEGYDFIRATVFGFAGGLSFMLALVLFAGVRERIEHNDIPKCMQGMSITLVSAALVALSFFGFQGLFR
jgi:electron transport complex protein RnfA